MTIDDVVVEGEPAALLIEALAGLTEHSREVDGLVRFEGQVGGDSGAALVHALGRITAELHADDIRSYLPGATPHGRTEGQRAADAFAILVERLHEALAALDRG